MSSLLAISATLAVAGGWLMFLGTSGALSYRLREAMLYGAALAICWPWVLYRVAREFV